MSIFSESAKQWLEEQIVGEPDMDALLSETTELSVLGTMAGLVEDLLAWMENVQGVYSLTMNAEPLVPTKTVLVSTQNKMQLRMQMEEILGVPHFT